MEAWAIVLKLVELADDDELLGDIGANPLEYLIEHHGPLLIDAIEAGAKLKPRLRQALSAVWLSESDSEVARRFTALGCQVIRKEA